MFLPTEQLQIRPARAGDARALIALQTQIYREERWFVGDGPVSAEVLARRLRAVDPELSLYIVACPARDQAKLCAWLELHRLVPQRLRHVAMLTLAVSAAHRRQGIAACLLRYSYRWGRRVGVEKIQLNVRAENSAAIRLYESQGFSVEGRELRQIREGNHYEDNVLMAKFLDEEA